MELYYGPVDEAATISLEALVTRLSESGLDCTIEPESEGMFWVVFESFETAMLASVEGGQFVFGTLQVATRDDPAVVYGVDRVMQAAGYSAGEGD
jgi:hypothetical protein